MRIETNIAPAAAGPVCPQSEGYDLTPRARELLVLLSAAPTCPTFEQMRIALGCKSKHSVAQLLRQLEERGYLRRRRRRARAIAVLRPLPAGAVPVAHPARSGQPNEAILALALLGPVPAPWSYPFRGHRSCAEWVEEA